MNHRTRILSAIRHEIPDRIPTHVISIDDANPYLKHMGFQRIEELWDYFGFGIRSVGPLYKGTRNGANVFGTSGGGSDYSATTFKRPFENVDSITDIEAYDWPDTADWDFDNLRHIPDHYDEYAIMLAGWNPVFCQVLDFFGMENAMVRLCLRPDLIEAAVARIEDYYLRFYKHYFEATGGRAHIFNMGDDFATQRGMMISPTQWRKHFKPTYKKIFELAKNHGLYVWFHSCGAIGEVLPDLIEIGMDVWETVQVHLPGNEPERIKREYGADIAFFGGINTQSTLPFGMPEQIRAEVRERIRVLGKGGGYICGPDHHIKVDVPVGNALALFDEIGRFRCDGYTL